LAHRVVSLRCDISAAIEGKADLAAPIIRRVPPHIHEHPRFDSSPAAAYLFFMLSTRRLEVSLFAHDAALHYLARRKEYDFSDEIRQQLIQVVLAFTGPCNEEAARAGLEWMREQARRRGERVRF
jgi:hypothetical protein